MRDRRRLLSQPAWEGAARLRRFSIWPRVPSHCRDQDVAKSGRKGESRVSDIHRNRRPSERALSALPSGSRLLRVSVRSLARLVPVRATASACSRRGDEFDFPRRFLVYGVCRQLGESSGLKRVEISSGRSFGAPAGHDRCRREVIHRLIFSQTPIYALKSKIMALRNGQCVR